MEATVDLGNGKDIFTLLDLLRQVAALKKLGLHVGEHETYSDPIKVYRLDEKTLEVLAKAGIKRQPRPDCRNTFTLVDENPQPPPVPGWMPSTWWNFKLPDPDAANQRDREGTPLEITLSVGFSVNTRKRGIVLIPQAHGSFVSAADRLPHFRMFKALVEADSEAPAVAKEIAASDGSAVVTWTELGLGGLRHIAELFRELVGENKPVDDLARGSDVFKPSPYHKVWQPGVDLYIAEPAQPKLFAAWQKQLEEYRAKLTTR